MRLIARKNLVAFAKAHPETKAALAHWERVMLDGVWRSTEEAAAAFSKAKTVSATRVRYEVAGGDYRLVAAFNFRVQIAFIKFLGSHAEYDKIDAKTVDQF